MPVPVFILRNLPSGMFDPRKDEPFRHALPKWRELGLSTIVERVTGNGVLNENRDGTHSLCVWPENAEMPITSSDATTIQIDDYLSIRWNGSTPPGPDDLDNGNPLGLSSLPLVLSDGNVWQIPEIRSTSGTRLPRDMSKDRRTGEFKSTIKREYLDLWTETEYWFDLTWKCAIGEAETFNLERALTFATRLLGLHYRFCDAVQSALCLIDSSNVEAIIRIAIGWPAFIAEIEDMQKKSIQSADDANGSCGPGG